MRKILHIDDNSHLLITYNEVLSADYDVTSLADSSKIESLISKQAFDAIILDIHMPKLNGAECIRKIRQCHKNKNTNLFILSGDVLTKTKIHFLKEGIQDFLDKTMSPDEILLRLKNGVTKKRIKSEFVRGNLILNKTDFTLKIKNIDVQLTLIEYKLFIFLTNANEQTVPRDDICNYLWGGKGAERSVLETHISNLRAKLKDWNYEIKSIRFKGLKIQRK